MRVILTLSLAFGLTACKGCDADKAPAGTAPSASQAPAVSITTSPALSANSAAVMAALVDLRPKLDACSVIDSDAGGGVGLAIHVPMEARVELTIAPDGTVADTKLTSRTGGTEDAWSCVRKVLESRRFEPPAGGKQVVINVPLHLR